MTYTTFEEDSFEPTMPIVGVQSEELVEPQTAVTPMQTHPQRVKKLFHLNRSRNNHNKGLTLQRLVLVLALSMVAVIQTKAF